jgi:ADP-ribose pyrophosphatase YjhB (NUDIX family)
MNQIEWEATIERAAVVAACLIKKDHRYLLVQESQPKAYGLWNLPAGHVDKGEKIREAAVRETKEETGYDVHLIKEVAVLHEEATNAVKHIFSANIVDGKISFKTDEIIDVKWLTFEEVKIINNDGKIRRPWVWDIIQKDHLETL